jgi:hypothetical protein
MLWFNTFKNTHAFITSRLLNPSLIFVSKPEVTQVELSNPNSILIETYQTDTAMVHLGINSHGWNGIDIFSGQFFFWKILQISTAIENTAPLSIFLPLRDSLSMPQKKNIAAHASQK